LVESDSGGRMQGEGKILAIKGKKKHVNKGRNKGRVKLFDTKRKSVLVRRGSGEKKFARGGATEMKKKKGRSTKGFSVRELGGRRL